MAPKVVMQVAGGGSFTAMKRIKKEIADLEKENLGDLVMEPNESNVFHWKAIIPGPPGSPYEGGKFEVVITLPPDYPFSPPTIHFETRVYHCNVNSNSGSICLDLLKNNWSPALSLYKVILSLSSLLTDPNPADPLQGDVAAQYKKDRATHDKVAREWTRQYAMPNEQEPAKEAVPPKPRAPTTTARSRAVHRPAAPPMTVASVVTPSATSAATRRANPYVHVGATSSSRTSRFSTMTGSSASTTRANGASNGTTHMHAVRTGSGSSTRPVDLAASPDSDMEVLHETSRIHHRGNGRDERPIKRARMEPGGHGRLGAASSAAVGSDDVIVIDE